MADYTYEEAVRWMRGRPEYAELVEQCYLDEDNLAAARRFAASEEFAAVADLLGLGETREKLRILDLGCGNGIASYAFALLGHVVSAVDPDQSRDVGLGAAARLAGAASPGLISTYHSFAESLPFPDGSFDIVYARQSLHHFQDLRRGLAECARVLKPGGDFLATREHVVSDEAQLEAFLADHPLHRLHGGERAYPLEDYLAALESAGLIVVRSLGPYDTVINHFPESNFQVKSKICEALKGRYGRFASVLLRVQRAEAMYRRRLSAGCDYPGRLYTFLCFNREKG
jgi:SAM-dependent methyltransferase